MLPVIQANQCGPCTLCCKVLGVPSLSKPSGVWCRFAVKGAGCNVYQDRPGSCRTFNCAWLGSQMPGWARPDLIHGVMADVGQSSFVLYEDPGWPGYASAALGGMIAKFILNPGNFVVVVTGSNRRIIAGPEAGQLFIHEVDADTFQVCRREE